MLRKRVIPCLLLQNNGLVKTKLFKDPVYVGDPINGVRIFNGKEVDELIFLDISKSKDHLEPQYDLIENIASEAFMPFAYGGGIKTLDQAARLFKIGVEKVILNTAALKTPQLIHDIATRFGAQSIVVSIDVKRNWLGKPKVYSHTQNTLESIDLYDYVKEVQRLGAGEIFINAVHLDGTQKGYDLDIIENVVKITEVPVICCGGAGQTSDFVAAFEKGASAVSAGSLFVFHGKHNAVLITYPNDFVNTL